MRYNFDDQSIELSVSELCLTACPNRDIDVRDISTARLESMKDAAIKKMRKIYSDRYMAFVSFTNTSKLDDIYLCVSGNADGVICDEGGYTVDQIKVVSAQSGYDSGFYASQLYCYAYFLCRSKGLDGVNVRLTYYTPKDGEIRYSQRYISTEALSDMYMQLLCTVKRKAEFLKARYDIRRPTGALAAFPYRELRDGQSDMIRECYLDIKHSSRLFCQAPTGIGKTVSVIYPSVRVWGDGGADKIFYLTSKASIKREAYNAARLIRESGVSIYTCSLSAKEHMCICKEKGSGMRISDNCRPDICPYAQNYYGKRDDAVFDMLENGYEFNREEILKYAHKHLVCPYELSLDLSEYCDILICDYNYVFSPLVYLRRYFECVNEKYVFLVDEAHNLPARARDMFSASISRSAIDELAQNAIYEYKNGADKLGRCASDVRDIFDSYREKYNDSIRCASDGNEYGYGISREMPYVLAEKLEDLQKMCEGFRKKCPESPIYQIVDRTEYQIYEFLQMSKHYGEGYITFTSISGADVSVMLYCLDPSIQLDACLSKARASVMFSATLTPASYYADVLGGGEDAVSVSFDSPFPKDSLCVAVYDGVSTRYEDRERSYKKIVSAIAATASARAGNYIVFFPSYGYMEKVYEQFRKKYPNVSTRKQRRNMSAQERNEFLDYFACDSGVLRIGFCVIGGSFSEGIDLPGDRLIGVIVIGVGMPGISDTNNIIREYYDEKCSEGYDYAYTYPGFNNVLQAVGRVIRDQNDRGIAVLIDDRYADPKYRRLFPTAWKDAKYAGDPVSLAEIARRFWNEGKK